MPRFFFLSRLQNEIYIETISKVGSQNLLTKVYH